MTIFAWRSCLRILRLVLRGGVSRCLVSEWHWLAVSHWLLVHLHLHLLLVHHVWWHVTESVHVWVETHWDRSHVFVWVETTETTRKSSQISNRGDLDHLILVVVWIELGWRNIASVVVLVIAVVSLLTVMALHLLWHWRESHAFWKVWKWVDQLSLICIAVIEGASVTEFAFFSGEEEFARLSFVV